MTDKEEYANIFQSILDGEDPEQYLSDTLPRKEADILELLLDGKEKGVRRAETYLTQRDMTTEQIEKAVEYLLINRGQMSKEDLQYELAGSSPKKFEDALDNIEEKDQVSVTSKQFEVDLPFRISKFVEEEINPYIAMHGGEIEVSNVDEPTGTVQVKMKGGCKGCAASKMTLKSGVESALVNQFKEVDKVEDITNHEEGENPYFEDSSPDAFNEEMFNE